MPGSGRYEWQWIGKAPIYWTIIFWIAMVEFVAGWVLFATLPRWARATPDAAHPVEMRMKFGHIYYLSAGIGWFMNNHLWIFFGLLGILALIMFLHRVRVQRIR
jgi:hypothetical protein